MPWDDEYTRIFGRKFAFQVEAHTALARNKFLVAPNHLDRDLPDKTFWLSVLMEEVGKLARVCNKLSLVADPDGRMPWNQEGQQRLITIASMVRRMAERWDEIPDQCAGPSTSGRAGRQNGS